MIPRLSIRALLSLALGIAIVQPAWGASPTQELETFFGSANAILRSADLERGTEAPRQAIRALVNEIFDYQDAAARALGPAWQSRTPAQQADFVRLFADLLERGYTGFIGTKANVSDGLHIRYLEESVTGESAAVATTLLSRSGSELDVDYFMIRRGERWMVRDVVVDGMSLIANYRAQFNRVLSTSSYANLVAKMQGGMPEVPGPAVASEVVPVAVLEATAPVPVRQEVEAAARPVEVAVSKVEAVHVAAPRLTAPVQPASTGTDALAASHYWVQVGAFRSERAAAQLAERLRRQGMAASHDPLTSVPWHSAGALARVRVGPFATHSDALSKLRQLIARGYAPFIAQARD